MSEFRIDTDSLGKVNVPNQAYYGPFSVRASKQYNVTGHAPHKYLIKAFVMIKRSAAEANRDLGVLDPKIAEAIIRACDDILEGKFWDQFIVEAINSGAGTALNMNTNEVIANRALEILGKDKGSYEHVNPNDHVNMSQSSNDTFPTAMHVAALLNMNETLQSLDRLIASLEIKSKEFIDVIKIGRTHLMDAIPVTLKDEFEAYAFSLKKAREKIVEATSGLEYVALGGTAVGSGANTPSGYKELAVKYLAKISSLNLKHSENTYYQLQSKFDISSLSSSIRNLAIELSKISGDIRMMASGPVAGLSEILIPAVHAGSSIMPGKVNPSLAETLSMICYNIIGNDVSVGLAAQAGQFELNVMLPGMIKCILDSSDMLKNFLPIFASNMIDGLQANKEKLSAYIEKSPVLVTLLNPYIGYNKAAEVYKEALKTNKSIKEIVISRGLMTEEDLDKALSAENILGRK